jgi:ABC-type Zn uptake system ZnuABC Zn-binding protein ZnuA
VTFHDGFAYFAKAFDLTIAAAIEEEAGSEASAADLKGIVALVEKDKIPAVFTETNGSTAAASVIESETGVPGYTLDMCLGETDYLTAMKNNIDTIGEALG